MLDSVVVLVFRVSLFFRVSLLFVVVIAVTIAVVIDGGVVGVDRVDISMTIVRNGHGMAVSVSQVMSVGLIVRGRLVLCLSGGNGNDCSKSERFHLERVL